MMTREEVVKYLDSNCLQYPDEGKVYCEVAEDIIDNIYDSIGTCETCKFADYDTVFTDVLDCSITSFNGSYYVDKTDYCSHYKAKEL